MSPLVFFTAGLLVEVLVLELVVLDDHLLEVGVHAVHVLQHVVLDGQQVFLHDECVLELFFDLVFLLDEQLLKLVLELAFDLVLVELDERLQVDVVAFNLLIDIVHSLFPNDLRIIIVIK